jgi:hypothetical protein
LPLSPFACAAIIKMGERRDKKGNFSLKEEKSKGLAAAAAAAHIFLPFYMSRKSKMSCRECWLFSALPMWYTSLRFSHFPGSRGDIVTSRKMQSPSTRSRERTGTEDEREWVSVRERERERERERKRERERERKREREREIKYD